MSTTNIFKDGVLADIDVSFWSGAKILKPEDLGLAADTIAEAYKLGKKMLIPADVIRNFRRIEGRARALVEANSFKFPIGNARFIPKKKFPLVLTQLKKYEAEYNTLVDDLIAKYDEYRKQMLPIYEQAAEHAFINQMPTTATFSLDSGDPLDAKKAFIESFMLRIASYYPPAESLRARFSLSWSVYEIAIPRMRQGDASEIAMSEETRQVAEEDYRKQIHQKIGGFVQDVVSVLRQETVDICSRIAANITEGKVIRTNTITGLKNFIERFSDLNFVGDGEIEASLDLVRKELLDAHPTSDFADNVELQSELKRRLNLIAEKAQNMTDVNSVTGEYRRKINWED